MAKTKLVHYAYTGHGEQYRQFIDHAKAIFERANANIEIEVVEGNDYTKALTMALGSGRRCAGYVDEPGFFIHVSGLLQDLTPFINADKEFRLQDFVPASLIGYQARGLRSACLRVSIRWCVSITETSSCRRESRNPPLGDGWTWGRPVCRNG